MEFQILCALPKRSYPLDGIPLYGLPGEIVEEIEIGGVAGGFVRKRDIDYSERKNDDDEVLLILMTAVNGGILQ